MRTLSYNHTQTIIQIHYTHTSMQWCCTMVKEPGLGTSTNMNWYKRNQVGCHAATNCIWSSLRHHDIMPTLSYNHTHTLIQSHTIIHIQAYTYNTIMQWCCTRGYETFLWKAVPTLVSAPASVQLSGLIVGSLVSAPATTVQFTRVLVESLVSAPATRAVYQIVGHIFCPAHRQLAKLIFEILVSAPAASAVQQIDCRIPGRFSKC